MPQTGEINKDGLTFVKGYGWITTEKFNQLFRDQINGPPPNSSDSLPPEPEEEQPTTAPGVNHFTDVTPLAHQPPPQNTPPNESMLPNNGPNFLPSIPENIAPFEGGNPPFQDNYFPPIPENTPPFEGNTSPTSFPENIPPNESGGFPTPFPIETPPIESSGNLPVNIPPNEDIGFPTPIGAPPQNVPPDDFSQPPTDDSYYPSGAYNVPPDEDMTATPADVYYLPDGTGGYKVIDSNTGQPTDSIPGSILPGPETGLPASEIDLPTNIPSDTPAASGPPLNLTPSPSVQSPFSDARLLPGATAGLGSFGPGNLGGWEPLHNMWFGKKPYTPENFAKIVGWQNSQGNALEGAKFSASLGPITYAPTSGGDYKTYLKQWNAVNAGNPAQSEADSAGSSVQASHSGVTKGQ